VSEFVYKAIRARQSESHQILSFPVKASDITEFAEVDRAGRAEGGKLSGFQRPQIASHVKEIRQYLSHRDAVLPNPIVVAFTDSVQLRKLEDPFVEITIDVSRGKPGFVVDGQQRLTALSGLPEKDFEVFVSAIICENYDELRRQFVLINNTRPLPKALIYELLPSVSGLPERLASRSFAAELTERLNYEKHSSLKGMIYQHTNPTGIIRDTAIQKVIITSSADGALRDVAAKSDAEKLSFDVISDFYGAVKASFERDWIGHNPKTSRLVHGAGIRAMGYVMDLLWERNSRSVASFQRGLEPLKGKTAWTAGSWEFGENEVIPWNRIQNVDSQIMRLAHHLVGIVRRSDTGGRTGK
jgi:DGQHR domain-containing protein